MSCYYVYCVIKMQELNSGSNYFPLNKYVDKMKVWLRNGWFLRTALAGQDR